MDGWLFVPVALRLKIRICYTRLIHSERPSAAQGWALQSIFAASFHLRFRWWRPGSALWPLACGGPLLAIHVEGSHLQQLVMLFCWRWCFGPGHRGAGPRPMYRAGVRLLGEMWKGPQRRNCRQRQQGGKGRHQDFQKGVPFAGGGRRHRAGHHGEEVGPREV